MPADLGLIAAIGLSFAGGAILCAWLMDDAACVDCDAKRDVRRLQAATMTALEGEARAKQEAADLRVIVKRYEDEAAEDAATSERIMENVMRSISVKPSRIVVEMPDVVTDSEAATEILQLCVGPLEVEGDND